MNDFKRKNLDQSLSGQKLAQMRFAHLVVKGRCIELILFITVLLVTFMSFAL